MKTSTRANDGSRSNVASRPAFLIARDKDNALIDPLDRRRGRRYGHRDRVVEVVLRQCGYRPRHGGREQQGLPPPGQQLHDALQRVDKAEVEHPVGLVENKNLDAREGEELAIDQIEQAPWRGDQDVDARREPSLLGPDRDAAENRHHGKRRSAAIGKEAFDDLGRELSSGAEHKCSAAARRCARGRPDRRCSMGNAKAAVLPVPVWAMPQRSRPPRTSGMARDWIGVGAVYPSAARARRIGAEVRNRKNQTNLMPL